MVGALAVETWSRLHVVRRRKSAVIGDGVSKAGSGPFELRRMLPVGVS